MNACAEVDHCALIPYEREREGEDEDEESLAINAVVASDTGRVGYCDVFSRSWIV